MQVVQSQLTLCETRYILHKTLKYGNILHKKEVKLNAPFLSTKQPIYFLFIIFYDNISVAPSFAAHFCTQFTKLKNICATALDIWSQSHPAWHISALALCVCLRTCVRSLCM